ncbi:Adenylate cyclase type 10 [Papilio machaon]|uniref:Adenylate cyclase type 10 n=1 Tax=Papilio machaon TaxID=76193 RepID=A0A194RKT8_PAPMA|nr:Adenylate cyclase type 10 [Papilio machaon]
MSHADNDLLEEDSTDEDSPKTANLSDLTHEFFGRESLSEEQIDQDVEVRLSRKQTLILATMVPDEILLLENFDEKREPKRFVGVLLMADVSGYTALSERYTNSGKGGTYRLTVTLNTYLGSLIEVIYSHGGDIIKFAGDAFLALWKTDKRSYLSHTIHTAIACALIIQHSFGSYETDVKVNLKVKLAISAGNLLFAPIGKGIDMNYIIFGLPVLEAKTAESLCLSGEVKLTPTAWGHCYSRNYDYVIHDDGHVTIKSILYDPREKDVTKPFLGFSGMLRQIKKPLIGIENLPENLLDVTKTKIGWESLKTNEALNVRKTILIAEERNIGSEIRKFMIRPVLTQIDAHQPLEYLTEMRHVSVLFITLKPRNCPFPQLITIVNNSYQITCEIVYKSMGCVNKIILFDKDIMILVVFGLRGFKHESEAQAALKCASGIKKSLSALDGVLEVSIGVTTGQVYCGVIGHPLRREFTIIGAVVNKAARFMCYFRNKITCDETTFVKSKMSSNGFTLQPAAELKGINHPGKIFEYTEEIRVKELYDIPVLPPLLNRSDEFEYFQNWIDNSHLSFRDFDALLFIGEYCSGKTRLLEWLTRYVRNKGLRTCYLSLSSIHSATPYLALGQIVNEMLGLKEPITGFSKEEKIVQMLNSYNSDLCYLNNIIKVRFAYHEGIYTQDENVRKEKAKTIFMKLIRSFPEPHVIFLDDLQNLDASSWEFISIMLDSPKIYTVLTITRGKFNSIQNWIYNVLINSSIRKIVLGPLSSQWIPALACQILDVEAVPKDLCDTLKTKCKGLPGLVESFIVNLFSNGALETKRIHKHELDNLKNEDLQFPDAELLRLQAVSVDDQKALDQFIADNSTEDIAVCIVTKKEQLNTDINEQNVDAIIMVQIDSLTPYQQLLLKIASVIGNVLSRTLLENIMYENNPLTTAKAIKRLFAMRILTCANIRYRLNRRVTNATSVTSVTINANLSCDCSFDYDPEEYENLPKYAFCKVMKFRNKNSRKTCYELLPMNQKKEFHSRIVSYLEKTKQKCPDCGGIIMIVQSVTNVSNHSYETRRSSNKIDQARDSDTSLPQIGEEIEVSSIDISQNVSSMNNRSAIEIRRTKSDSSSRQALEPKSTLSDKNTRLSLKQTDKPSTILKNKNERLDIIDGNRRSMKRVTMTSLLSKDISFNEMNNSKIFDMLRAVTEASTISEWHELGVVDSCDDVNENGKGYFKLKIERGVSKTRFEKCACLELNITIYEQLINHAREADLKVKMIEFLINYSYFNLLANNFECIYPKLDEAEDICFEKVVENMTSFDKRRFLGRIHSLRAAALLMSGKLAAAKIHIERATKIYGFNLDKVSDFFNIRNIITATPFKRSKYLKHSMILKSDSIFCLNVITLLFSALGDDNISRVSALRALNLTQKVKCNIIDLCDAFSNAIQVELVRGNAEFTKDIERMAILTFKNLSQPIQAEEMFAIGKFFMASFRGRLARGKLAEAIRSGFRSLVISRFLHADTISLDMIPDLFYILLSRRRIEEAIDILKLSFEFSYKQSTTEWETWYYALCMDLILDAGFQLETPNEISRYAEHALNTGLPAGLSRRRLIVGLWTYWLRADVDRKAKRFEAEALNWTAYEEDDGSLNTLLSAMRLAEGMLESLARKMDDLRKASLETCILNYSVKFVICVKFYL